MKMKISMAFLSALAAAQLFAAGGNCMQNAAPLFSSQTARLVREYDPDWKEYDDESGVAYFKVTLTRGKAYTIYIQGGDAQYLGLDVDTDIDDEKAPWATFEGPEFFDGGNIQACYLYADDWSEDDPAKGTYYVCVDGEVGQSTTLRFVSGIVGFTQEGEKDNPRNISFKDSASFKHEKKTFVDGSFWYKATLKAGRKYVVCTKGSNYFAMDTESVALEVAEEYTNTYSNAYYLFPEKDVTAKFHVDQLNSKSTTFDFYYRAVPAWKPGDSRRTVYDLTAENDYAEAVVPGRVNTTTSVDGANEHYDAIIDESLCRIKLAKGERWVFETLGAQTNIQMVVYNPDGSIMGSNTSMGDDSYECRVAITAAKAGYHYIGVCDPLLAAKDRPGSDKVTVKAVNADSIPKPDLHDPDDDMIAGANWLEAYPGTVGGNVEALGFASDEHALNGGDWYDCYRIACRKGVTYDLRAVFAGEERTTLSLGCKVFYMKSGKETTIESTGELTPFGASDLVFKSPVNGIVYLRVWVAEGIGLNYPLHKFHVMAYDTAAPEAGLGWLKVITKGADGQWCLSDKTYYPNGAVVNVVSNQTVSFKAVSGFATPASIKTNVLAGVGADVPRTVVAGIYYDSYDKYTKTVKGKKKTVTDNDMSGAVSIAPANKAVLASRTLWKDDPRDIFTFKVTTETGVYYNFRLLNTTLDDDGNEIAGDQVFTVSNATGTVYGPTTALTKQLFTAGTWYLTVAHAVPEDPQDSCYKLEYSAYKTGSIAFSAVKYSVKESAEYATLTVKRSANQGIVRVRYETFAGTSTNDVENAKPGSEYYPTNGIITWANGDKKDKTIKVRLIPDMINQYEAAKRFTVKLTPMDPDDIPDDDTEYLAVITRDEATVTLSEVTKAVPGKIQAVSYGTDGVVFPNLKKPAMTVDAGKAAVINIRRMDGDDGKVAVKVQTIAVKKSAVAETDYTATTETFVWGDNNAEDVFSFTVPTMKSHDLVATKKFIVRITVLTTGEYKGFAKASVYAKDVTVTIKNDTFRQALADYAKIAKKDGVTLAGKGATWYVDPDGNLRSSEAAANATMTFTVTGPGLFAADVEGCCAEGGTKPAVTCTVAKVSAEVDGRVVRIIPSGKQNIVFTKSGEGWMSFKDLGGGKTYKWIPFKSAVTPFSPSNKAVVNSNGVDKLVWTPVPGFADELGLKTRVVFGTSSKSLKTVLSNVTDNVRCEIRAEDREAFGGFQPSKTYYWALEYALPKEGEASVWTRSPTIWQFSTAAKNAAKTIAGVGGEDERDTYGRRIDELTAVDGIIELVQGVKARVELGPDGVGVRSTKTRILAGSLPPGLKLDGAAGVGLISGVPSKPGKYEVVVQTATGTTKKPVYAESITLRFNVSALGTAIGSFRGTMAEDGLAMETGAHRLGLFTFSATSAGKLSASVKIAGKTYKFSGTGYDEIIRDDTLDVDKQLTVTLTSTTKIKSGTKYANELVIKLGDGSVTNMNAVYGATAVAGLRLNVLNSKSTAVAEDVDYLCDLYRNNSSIAEYKADAAAFNGYYTVALAPDAIPGSGLPSGNGYMTLTVSGGSTVKIAGMLADGTKLSASTVGTYDGEKTMFVPIYFGSSSYCFGGVAKLILGENDADGYPTTVVDASDVALTWNKDGSKSSEDGEGFRMDISPAGGWYNTLVSLQRYYLDRDFELDGIPVYLYGNSVKLNKTTGETVSKISYSIKRTTGVASGKLTYRKKSVNHYGILTFNRDANALLDPEVWTAGFFVDKANTKWTESLPFDILGTKVDRDWSESDPEEPPVDPE